MNLFKIIIHGTFTDLFIFKFVVEKKNVKPLALPMTC